MKLLDKLDPVWKDALASRGIEPLPSSNDLTAMSKRMDRGEGGELDLGGGAGGGAGGNYLDVRDGGGGGALGGARAYQADLAPTLTGAITQVGGGGRRAGVRCGGGGVASDATYYLLNSRPLQDDLDALAELTPTSEPRNPLTKAFWKRHLGTDALVGNWLWCIGTAAYMALAIFRYSQATTTNAKVDYATQTVAASAFLAGTIYFALLSYPEIMARMFLQVLTLDVKKMSWLERHFTASEMLVRPPASQILCRRSSR